VQSRRFSSRRFRSDLREARERGLIERVPHFKVQGEVRGGVATFAGDCGCPRATMVP
jgi:hypothetical protein